MNEVISLAPQPAFTYKNIPGTYFCSRVILPQFYSAAGKMKLFEKSSNLIGN
jgi:hypothetical protein